MKKHLCTICILLLLSGFLLTARTSAFRPEEIRGADGSISTDIPTDTDTSTGTDTSIGTDAPASDDTDTEKPGDPEDPSSAEDMVQELSMTISSGDPQKKTIVLSWEPLASASSYRISFLENGEWIPAKETIGTEVTVKAADYGKKRTYCLQAYDPEGTVIGSSGKVTAIIPKEVKKIKTDIRSNDPKNIVRLTWHRSKGATAYRIYKKTAEKSYRFLTATEDTSLCLKYSRKKYYSYKILPVFENTSGRIKGIAGSIRFDPRYCIVIDAGHQRYADTSMEPIGPGASKTKAKVSGGTKGIVSGLSEYELNLQVAIRLKKALSDSGYRVVMVRETHDVNISNSRRAALANQEHADAFLRIHANGSTNQADNGIMTICQTRHNPYNGSLYAKSRLLSEKILEHTVRTTGARKEYVWETDTMSGINWAQVPVTILEMGYMTNAAEDSLLATGQYQDKIVKGIVSGLRAYFSGYYSRPGGRS